MLEMLVRSDWKKVWQQRFFVLKGFRLFYFYSPNERARGCVDMHRAVHIKKTLYDGVNHGIEVELESQPLDFFQNSYHLYCDDQQLRDQWYLALKAAMMTPDTEVVGSPEQFSLRGALPLSEAPLHQGYLKKRPISSQLSFMDWKLRYFYLLQGSLVYAKSRNATEPLGKVMLSSQMHISLGTLDDHPYCFILSASSNVTEQNKIYLEADSYASREVWVEAIRSVLQLIGNVPRTRSSNKTVRFADLPECEEKCRDELVRYSSSSSVGSLGYVGIEPEGDEILYAEADVVPTDGPADMYYSAKLRDVPLPLGDVAHYYEVALEKPGLLELKISRHSVNPFPRTDDDTIYEYAFVSDVAPGGLADRCGIKTGSYLLAIDHMSMIGVQFTEILRLLKRNERPLFLRFAFVFDSDLLSSPPNEWKNVPDPSEFPRGSFQAPDQLLQALTDSEPLESLTKNLPEDATTATVSVPTDGGAESPRGVAY